MSKVISVLEKMASDAAMTNESAIADLVVNSNISDGQQKAIIAHDVEALVESTINLPEVKCFILVPAEDDEPVKEEENTDEQAIAINA